jgi:hypothetical protein
MTDEYRGFLECTRAAIPAWAEYVDQRNEYPGSDTRLVEVLRELDVLIDVETRRP